MTMKKHPVKKPPFVAKTLLGWLLPDDWQTPVGDFEEYYNELAQSRGVLYARWWYRIQVIRLIPGRLYENVFWGIIMLKNYIKVAFRNLRNQPVYSLINVSGLALGIACFLLVTFYVLDELSYDRFHTHADRIVRVNENQDTEGRINQYAYTYGPLAPILEDEIPSVVDAVRLFPYPVLVNLDTEKQFQEGGFTFADSTFLDVFSFAMARGNREAALDEPFTLVLTASTANRYFGSQDPIGRTLQVRDNESNFEFRVTGVLEDLPSQTHFDFDMLASMGSLRQIYPWVTDPNNWEYPPVFTYALLDPKADLEDVEELLPSIAATYMGPDRTATRSLHAERLTDIHLYSEREADLTPGSNIIYIYIFGLSAFFILLIACINFINLVTAQAVERAKEVGMRKTLGAVRSQVKYQFLMEAMVIAGISVVLGMILVIALLPAFNSIAGKSVAASVFFSGAIPFILVGLVLIVSMIAGGYPAFYLSRFLPIEILEARRSVGRYSHAAMMRKGLVIFQFVISITFLVGTFVVNQQLEFLQNDRLGFHKEHVVIVPLRDSDDVFNYVPLKNQWEQLGGVLHVTASSGMPALPSGVHDFMIKPRNADLDSLEMLTLTVDHDFVETYGMEIIAGRDFSETFPSDAENAFLINEAAARKLGWEDPLNQQLTLEVWFRGEVQKTGAIIGVLKDFQYNSLHTAIDPLLLHIFPNTYYNDYLSVRLAPDQMEGTLKEMEEAWGGFNATRPFEYTFLDDSFDALYRTEAKMSQLFSVVAILALMIGCFGLFGLASYMVTRRVKEVGVRKVLGASPWNIIVLLSSDFVKLVSISFIIAIPIAYFTLNHWLQGFAERIDIGIGVFIVAGVLTLFFTCLVVNYQAYKAALMDPVKALRYE